MRGNDYPKIVTVLCALCSAPVTIALELLGQEPQRIDGLMRVQFLPEPTVLDGCEHFHEKGENPDA